MQQRWKIFFLCQLFAFYPLIFLASANVEQWQEFFTVELIPLSSIFFAFGLIIFAIGWQKKSIGPSLLFSLALIMLFAWRPFTELAGGEWLSRFIIYLIGFVIILYIGNKMVAHQKGRKVLLISLLAITLLPLGQALLGLRKVTWGLSKSQSPIVESWRSTKASSSSGRNVYVILFDSMSPLKHYRTYFPPTPERMKQLSKAEETLRNHGFIEIQNLRSNYPRTSYSMISFFNQQYFQNDLPTSNAGFADGRWAQEWQGRGWSLVSYEYYEGQCSTSYEHCFNFPRHHVLTSFLFTNTPFRYLVHKLDKYVFRPLNSPLMKIIFAGLGPKKLEQLDALEKYFAEGQLDSPKMMYVHLEGMHGPNFFGPNCKITNLKLYDANLSERVNVDVAFNPLSYAEEYPCLLSKMESLAQVISKKDPNAIVALFADHGYGIEKYGHHYDGPWHEKQLAEAYDVIAFVRAPEQCSTYWEGLGSLVNFSRRLSDCAFGRPKRDLLPNEHYFLDPHKNQLVLVGRSPGPMTAFKQPSPFAQ